MADENNLLVEAEMALRHALSLLDRLGRDHEAVLVTHALEIMGADIMPATRAVGE